MAEITATQAVANVHAHQRGVYLAYTQALQADASNNLPAEVRTYP